MINYLCAADGIQTRVLEVGKGPVIVFVHGLGARADRWRSNLEPIAAAGYRCVAIDLPGHGFATKSDAFQFSVPHCARWLMGILDQLEISRYALVGTSLGGFICSHIACEIPDRISAVMLVGAIGITPMGGEARAAISSRFGTVTREGIERKLNTVLFDPKLVTPAWIEEEWRINNSLGAHDAFASIAEYLKDSIDDDVVGERLAGYPRRPPIAVVWGSEDRAVSLEVGHRVRDLLQPEVYQEIPETGHGPYLEKPGVFNELVVRFLRQQINLNGNPE